MCTLQSQVIKGRPQVSSVEMPAEQKKRSAETVCSIKLVVLLVHSGSKQREGDGGCCAQSDFTVHSVKPDWSRCYPGLASNSGEGARV